MHIHLQSTRAFDIRFKNISTGNDGLFQFDSRAAEFSDKMKGILHKLKRPENMKGILQLPRASEYEFAINCKFLI